MNYLLRYMRRPGLHYLLLAIVILGPLLLPGYILTLDMSWGPLRPQPTELRNISPLYWLIAQMGSVLPGWVSQKLMLLVVFTLAGLGAHRLAQAAWAGKHAPSARLFYLAGLLYAVNPFIYTRLVAGQWLVMLGYALLPWAVLSFWQLLQRPDWRRLLIALGWTAAVGFTSLHVAGFLPLIWLVLLVAAGRQEIGRRLGYVAGFWLVLLLANAFWLVPLLLGHSRLAGEIASFDSSQLKAFATQGTVLGSVPLSTLLLSGFWADPFQRYILPQATGPLWWGGALLIVGLVAVGAVITWRRRLRLGLALLALGLIAWLLAMGVAFEGTRGLAVWLAGHVPFYAGYREPQKWLALLALCYAVLVPGGAAWLTARLPKRLPTPAVIGSLLLVPLLWTPMQLAGAGGQLRSAEYPPGWQRAVAALREAGAGPSTPVLVLPWHMYLAVDFAGRTTANPAPFYFDAAVITSNNPELRGVPAEPGNAVQDYMNYDLLPSHGHNQDAGLALKRLGVRYVIVMKHTAWTEYYWLFYQRGLKAIVNDQDVIIFAVTG